MQIQLHAEFIDSRTAQTYRTTYISVRRQGKEATYSTTTAPTRHPRPCRRQNATHILHDTPPTDQATHPPTPPTMLKPYSSKRMRCSVLELCQSRRVIQRRKRNTTAIFLTTTTCERSRASGAIRPTLKTVHLQLSSLPLATRPLATARPYHARPTHQLSVFPATQRPTSPNSASGGHERPCQRPGSSHC